MPRKPIGERPMTDAERQARCRAARESGTPAVRIRRPLDHRSRAKRWCDAVSELTTLQGQYAAWLEALPDNLHDSATAEALQATLLASSVMYVRIFVLIAILNAALVSSFWYPAMSLCGIGILLALFAALCVGGGSSFLMSAAIGPVLETA